MKRLRRILFNVLAVLSLLLCVGTMGLWIRGPVTVGDYGNSWAGEAGREVFAPPVVAFGYGFAFRSAGGTMRFHWHYIRLPKDRLSIGSIWSDAEPNRAGFAWHVAPTGHNAGNGKPWARQGTAAVPHWFLTVLFTVLPGFWLYRFLCHRLAKRRSRSGLCPSCRYDLTANVSGVCPECGTKVEVMA